MARAALDGAAQRLGARSRAVGNTSYAFMKRVRSRLYLNLHMNRRLNRLLDR